MHRPTKCWLENLKETTWATYTLMRIILKWILNKQDIKGVLLDSSGSEYSSVPDSCEQCNELSASIEVEEFPDQVSYYQIPKKRPTLWRSLYFIF
jgi:hypothetical protein